jgi:hypothetical protein
MTFVQAQWGLSTLAVVVAGTTVFAYAVTIKRTYPAPLDYWAANSTPCTNREWYTPTGTEIGNYNGPYPKIHEPFATASSLVYIPVAIMEKQDPMVQLAAVLLAVSSMMLHANEAVGSREYDFASAAFLTVAIASRSARAIRPTAGAAATVASAFAVFIMFVRDDQNSMDAAIAIAALWAAGAVAGVIVSGNNNDKPPFKHATPAAAVLIAYTVSLTSTIIAVIFAAVITKTNTLVTVVSAIAAAPIGAALVASFYYRPANATGLQKILAAFVMAATMLAAGWAVKDKGNKLKSICTSDNISFANTDINHAMWHIATAYAATVASMIMSRSQPPDHLAFHAVPIAALIIYIYVAVAIQQAWETSAIVIIASTSTAAVVPLIAQKIKAKKEYTTLNPQYT